MINYNNFFIKIQLEVANIWSNSCICQCWTVLTFFCENRLVLVFSWCYENLIGSPNIYIIVVAVPSEKKNKRNQSMIQRTLRTGCEFYVRTWGWFSVRSSHSKVSIGSHCENRSENRVSIWEPPDTRVLLCLLILGSFCGYKISIIFQFVEI